MIKNYFLNSFFLPLVLISLFCGKIVAQVNYVAAGTYGLRLISPTYTGSAIQVRRTCDNATKDIGFSCGALNTTSLSDFVIASNPLSAISSSAATAYSLRKLSCLASNTVAVNVRRSCDNATSDIGFTSTGDFDTTSFQKFVFKSYPLSAISASAAAAYSLRKLYCAYAGNAILVRRSSDNTTQAIGFTATGDLNTAALLTFVGAGNGFIQTWYDQSGNNNNATAPANGNQPQIVAAGVVNTLNGQPTAVFDGSTSYMSVPYAATMDFSSASTTNVVFAKTTASPTGDAAIFDQQYNGGGNNISAALSWNNNTGSYAPLSMGYYTTSAGSWQYAPLSTDVTTSTDYIISGTILSGAGNTTAINLYQNGTLAATATNKNTVGTQASQPFNIGKRWDLGNYAPMNLQELIVFASVLSTTDRQYLEFSQSAYYSISGPPSLTAIPAAAQSAFVTKWYDQSGNTRDASQAATGSQPRIMNAGIIDRQNNMPAVYFQGLTYGLATANLNIYTTAACFNGVAKVNANLTHNTIVNKTGSGAANNYPGPLDFYNGSFLVGNGVVGQYNNFAMSQTFNAAQPLGIWTYQSNGTNASGANAYYNSTNVLLNQTATYLGDNSTPLYIGSRADGGNRT